MAQGRSGRSWWEVEKTSGQDKQMLTCIKRALTNFNSNVFIVTEVIDKYYLRCHLMFDQWKLEMCSTNNKAMEYSYVAKVKDKFYHSRPSIFRNFSRINFYSVVQKFSIKCFPRNICMQVRQNSCNDTLNMIIFHISHQSPAGKEKIIITQ